MSTPTDPNPYASPQTDSSLDVEPTDKVWRDGDLLVAPIGAVLPRRCLKCGKEASQVAKTGIGAKPFSQWRQNLVRGGLVGFSVFAFCIAMALARFNLRKNRISFLPEEANELLPLLFSAAFLVLISAVISYGIWHRRKVRPLHFHLCRWHQLARFVSNAFSGFFFALYFLMMSAIMSRQTCWQQSVGRLIHRIVV